MSSRFWAGILIGVVWLTAAGGLRAQNQFNRNLLMIGNSQTTPDTAKHKSLIRSPRGALWRALAFPGWGQWYNGKKAKAVLVFTAETGLIATAIYWNQKVQSAPTDYDRAFYENNRNLSNWWLLFTIFMSATDAYVDAQLSNFDVSPNLSFSESHKALPIGISLRIHFN
ncbi:MAG: hypothetical protein GXO76_02705 [Calditrichaeota bacterium]|nr:hypothetical protein [Calditrichota bacterium]